MSELLIAHKSLNRLSRLLLPPEAVKTSIGGSYAELERDLGQVARPEFESLVALAETNHVLMRGIGVFKELASRRRKPASIRRSLIFHPYAPLSRIISFR
jgi:hypothetical protein